MNVALYVLIFIMGSFVGSFLTLATYRIPLNQDITHKRSYCPNCNHRLEFLDLIPVFSYIFLGAKCRYCKKRISPRYFLIETCCGLLFMFFAWALNFNVYDGLNIIQIVEFVLISLYIIFLFLVGQIDKERGIIDKRVIIYGFIISILKVLFDYFISKNQNITYNLNRIIIYLLIILILNIISIKRKGKENYYISLMIICAIMSIFTYEITTILSITYAILIVAIKLLIDNVVNKKNKTISKERVKMPVTFYLAISNIIIVIIAILCKWGYKWEWEKVKKEKLH